MLAPSTECIWGCGRSNFNREHVVGRQLAERLGFPQPLVMRWGEYWRMESELEVIVRDRVCEGCNGRWMKKLDDEVADVLGTSITEGAPVDLTPWQQHQAARWALKVALLLMLWTHDECALHPELMGANKREPHVPIDDFASVGKRHRPPHHTLIWLGLAADELPDYFSIVSTLARPAHPSPEWLGYYSLFAIGRLVVYVLAGTPDPREPGDPNRLRSPVPCAGCAGADLADGRATAPLARAARVDDGRYRATRRHTRRLGRGRATSRSQTGAPVDAEGRATRLSAPRPPPHLRVRAGTSAPPEGRASACHALRHMLPALRT